jgi:hypothetical protein
MRALATNGRLMNVIIVKAPSIAALGEEIERARATPRSRGAERVSTA